MMFANRYGGLSFGERNPLVEANYTMMEEYMRRLLVAANGGAELEADVTLPRLLEDVEQILSSVTTRNNAKVTWQDSEFGRTFAKDICKGQSSSSKLYTAWPHKNALCALLYLSI